MTVTVLAVATLSVLVTTTRHGKATPTCALPVAGSPLSPVVFEIERAGVWVVTVA